MEILCTIYYICSYTSSIPSIIKLLRTKHSNDYSMTSTIVSEIGITCWAIYIFSTKQSTIVYLGTIVDQFLYTLWNLLIIIYYKRETQDKKGS
jgi:uncharacterized protein with PQ loop repeat